MDLPTALPQSITLCAAPVPGRDSLNKPEAALNVIGVVAAVLILSVAFLPPPRPRLATSSEVVVTLILDEALLFVNRTSINITVWVNSSASQSLLLGSDSVFIVRSLGPQAIVIRKVAHMTDGGSFTAKPGSSRLGTGKIDTAFLLDGGRFQVADLPGTYEVSFAYYTTDRHFYPPLLTASPRYFEVRS